jgi:DNA-binding response OmpR family regulator
MAAEKEKALIVEDCRTVAAIVTHYLKLEGFDVVVAPNGVAGLEIARREQPRFIVTDVNMPGMGGLDLVRALRADARTHDITIFMLTSDESEDARQQALAAGADDYMLKPVQPRLFAAHVRAVLDRADKSLHE